MPSQSQLDDANFKIAVLEESNRALKEMVRGLRACIEQQISDLSYVDEATDPCAIALTTMAELKEALGIEHGELPEGRTISYMVRVWSADDKASSLFPAPPGLQHQLRYGWPTPTEAKDAWARKLQFDANQDFDPFPWVRAELVEVKAQVTRVVEPVPITKEDQT